MKTKKHDWLSSPERAWVRHIYSDAIKDRYWLENSKPISAEILLSNRELFGLIILAHQANGNAKKWKVGFNKLDREPNDGFIANGSSILRVEHKIVAQFDKRELLLAIKGTYETQRKLGSNYGIGRTLLIQANKNPDHGPGGVIEISSFTELIDDDCPFDQVITLGLVGFEGENNETGVYQLHRNFPKHAGSKVSGGWSQVNFNYSTGEGELVFSNFDL